MIASRIRPLPLAIVAALAFSVIAPVAIAQQADPKQSDGTMSMRDKRAQRLAEIRGETGTKKNETTVKEEAKPARYPNATRVSPEAKATGKMLKQLQDMQALYEKKDMVGVMAKADDIAAMPSAGDYDKSFAYSLAANAAADQNDDAKAADYFRKALDSNGLDNDSHYTTMFNLAVTQYQQEKYAESLATLDRFLAETKSEQPEHLGLRAGLLANLGRNDDAAAAYKALIAKSPNDKRLLMNAVATLQAADKFDQANVLLEDAYKRGMLNDAKELRALYVGYLNESRWSDAKAVMDAGINKGILVADNQLAKDYMVLAQNAYANNDIALAVEMYTRAGPIASDGEAYLNLAKVLDNSGKKAEAKAAAQKALEKGVKKPEEAKRLLSR